MRRVFLFISTHGRPNEKAHSDTLDEVFYKLSELGIGMPSGALQDKELLAPKKVMINALLVMGMARASFEHVMHDDYLGNGVLAQNEGQIRRRQAAP